ncbi:MAG: PA14 domain-containing protein, partial [Candidatus Heimdallarchaeota archaeon]
LTSAWPLFETERTTYEPAWWMGGPVRDPNAGTVVYNSPALEEFPHEGWCDLQFQDLINNRYVMLLDDIPGAKKPIIRAIDSYVGSRHKSFLSEWKVGKGSLLVSTLNLDNNAMNLPEARWLFQSFIRYGTGKKFLPKAELPVTYIEKRMGHDSKPPIISSPKFKYYYYEGYWTIIPDYFNITPLDSGYVSKIKLKDIKFTDRKNYTLLFKGYFNIEKSENYTFYSTSNDGSILSVDNIKVVDNNGSHGTLEKSGSIYLSAGIHYIEVRYFQRGGGKELRVSYESANIERQEIIPIKFTIDQD